MRLAIEEVRVSNVAQRVVWPAVHGPLRLPVMLKSFDTSMFTPRGLLHAIRFFDPPNQRLRLRLHSPDDVAEDALRWSEGWTEVEL